MQALCKHEVAAHSLRHLGLEPSSALAAAVCYHHREDFGPCV
jgi:hypothetical protein